MIGAVTVKLSGFKELEAELAKLTKAVGRGVLTRAGIAALEPMARAARMRAPVDTGALQESISVGARVDDSVGRAEYAAVMRAGGTAVEALSALRDARRAVAGQAPSVVLYMGPERPADKDEAIKALVQEYGSSSNAPQPYMRPAFDAEAMPTIDRLKDELWWEVSLAVERAERRAARRAAGG